jgi:hypothetical protein
LRRYNDERKILALTPKLGRSVDAYLVEICAALAGSMEKQKERPAFRIVLMITLR